MASGTPTLSSDPVLPDSSGRAPEWRVESAPIPYAAALQAMEARVAAIRQGTASELVWLLEHPSVITAGIQAEPADLLQPGRFPVFRAGRGGRYTYHGPGQRVVYVLLDLRRRQQSLHHFIEALERWMVAALGDFGVRAFTSDAGVGLWVAADNGGQEKIAAIGVRVRHGVTFHGTAINVTTDLGDFDAIVPCGIRAHGVARLADLVRADLVPDRVGMDAFDASLARHFSAFLADLAPGGASLASGRANLASGRA